MPRVSNFGKGIAVLLAVIIIGGGIYLLQKKGIILPGKSGTQVSSTPARIVYNRIDNSYSFEIPDAYNYDDVSIPGATIIYPAGSQINASTVEALYSGGAITIVSDRIFNGNAALFRPYVENEVTAQLTKNKYTFTHAPSKVQSFDAEKFFVSKPFPLVQSYVNTPTVTIVSAPLENNATLAILNSLKGANQSVSAQDQEILIRLNRLVIDDLQRHRLTDLYQFTSQDIQKKLTQDKFVESFTDQSTKLAAYAATFNGFTFSQGAVSFLDQLIAPDGKTHTNMSVTLQKNADNWEVSGINLQPIADAKAK